MGPIHTPETPQQWEARQAAASYAYQTRSVLRDLQQWINEHPGESGESARSVVNLLHQAAAELDRMSHREEQHDNARDE